MFKRMIDNKLYLNHFSGTPIALNGSSRITGGKKLGRHSSLARVPWHVALVKEIEGELNIFCGAVLLNEQFILSAAHCEEGLSFPSKVLIGSSSKQDLIYDTKLHLLAARTKIHPKYQDFTWKPPYGSFGIYDFMILKLKEPLVNMCSSVFAKLPFDSPDVERLADKTLILSGFGSTVPLTFDESNALNNMEEWEFYIEYERWPTNLPHDLQLLESHYVSYEICQKRFETFFANNHDVDGVNVIPQRKLGSLKFRKDAMLCTSPRTLIDDGGSKPKGFCSGDSGG